MNIKKSRCRIGLSRADFGKKIGVSARTVEAWEQGRRQPSKAAKILIEKLIARR